MATVNIGSTAGAELTWDTAAFTWAVATKTWATAIGTNYSASVVEDTEAFTDKIINANTKKNKETCAFAEKPKKAPTKLNKETVAFADLVKKSAISISKDAVAFSDAFSALDAFIRTLAETLNTADTIFKVAGKTNKENLTTIDSKGYDYTWGNTDNTWDSTSDTWNTVYGVSPWFTIVSILNETLSLAESNPKTASKRLYEAVSIANICYRLLTLYRTFAETLATAEMCKNAAVSVTNEALGFTDVYKDMVSFLRKYAESITAIESSGKTISKTFNQQSFSIADSQSYIATFNRILDETVNLAEILSNNTIRPIFESLGFADVYIDYIAFMLRTMEFVNLADVTVKVANSVQCDSLAVAEMLSNDTTKITTETLSLIGILQNFLLLLKNEYMSTDEQTSRTEGVLQSETVIVAEQEKQSIDKPINESVNVSEVYWDIINFLLRVLESVVLAETLQKTVDIPKFDSFSVADKATKGTGKISKVALATSDTINNQATFERILSENIGIIEKLAKELDISKTEVMKIVSVILSNANAILSDILISSGDLDFDTFNLLDVPAGFEEFSSFMPGEYQFKKALIRLLLNAGVTSNRPEVDEWKLNIDLQDITDKGNARLSVGSNRIAFSRTFTFTPEVSITTTTASMILGDIDIDAIGFTVASEKNGTISWIANGN